MYATLSKCLVHLGRRENSEKRNKEDEEIFNVLRSDQGIP